MKKSINIGLIIALLVAIELPIQAQQMSIDSLEYNRFVTRTNMYGVGYTNVFDTYLSPQEYTGMEFRYSRESNRLTKMADGKISVQTFFQSHIGYTENKADNNNTFSGLANWNYALHYNFKINEHFKVLAG